MLLQGAPDKDGNSSRQELSELEIEAVEMFINFLKLIGLPKSVGEIYGLLFVSPRALPMEEIITRLSISLGAASQGLKLLRNFGAVQTVYSAGDRRYHFAADLELSKFATALINDELRPRVDRAAERICCMEQLLATLPDEEREIALQRVDRLNHWLGKGQKMMPWILRFLVR